MVAVGTEQGYVNLYSVEDDDIVYKKLFDKQEGRIMCCKFDHTGNILVTGNMYYIIICITFLPHQSTTSHIQRMPIGPYY